MTIKMTLADGTILEGSAEDLAKLQQLKGGEQAEEVVEVFDKPAQVGDTILITDACVPEGLYINGDRLTVTDVDSAGDIVGVKELDDPKYIADFEFVIVGRNPEQVGEVFEEGDVVQLTIEEGKSPKYSWGNVDNGDVGTVRSTQFGYIDVDFPKQRGWSAHASELKKVAKADIPFVKVGRNPGEYKKGDIVRVVVSPGASPEGTLVEIVGDNRRSPTYWGDDGFLYNVSFIEPVVFAEDRVDQHV